MSKSKILWIKEAYFFGLYSSPHGLVLPHGYIWKLLRKLQRKSINIGFQTLSSYSYNIGIGVLGIAEKLSVPCVTLCKKYSKINKIYCLEAAQNPIDHNLVDRNFKG